jgi:hypothetical protein
MKKVFLRFWNRNPPLGVEQEVDEMILFSNGLELVDFHYKIFAVI